LVLIGFFLLPSRVDSVTSSGFQLTVTRTKGCRPIDRALLGISLAKPLKGPLPARFPPDPLRIRFWRPAADCNFPFLFSDFESRKVRIFWAQTRNRLVLGAHSVARGRCSNLLIDREAPHGVFSPPLRPRIILSSIFCNDGFSFLPVKNKQKKKTLKENTSSDAICSLTPGTCLPVPDALRIDPAATLRHSQGGPDLNL